MLACLFVCESATRNSRYFSGGFPLVSEQTDKRNEPEFLNSWKEIANYMGRGVRTVQRYEVQYGLPVRRPAGKSRSSVMATRAEIDAWVDASPIREDYQLSNLPNKTRSAADVSAMRDAILQMHKLRQQMMELRAENHLALNLFMSSLDTLHRELNTQASGYGVIADSPNSAGTNLGWNSSSPAGKLAKGVA